MASLACERFRTTEQILSDNSTYVAAEPPLSTCLFEASTQLAGGFFGILFFWTVGRQVAQFVGHPVAKPVGTLVTVVVDEDGSAGQVGKHLAAIAGRNMESKGLGGVQVFPMGHEDDSRRKNRGLHNVDLSSQQRFLLRG